MLREDDATIRGVAGGLDEAEQHLRRQKRKLRESQLVLDQIEVVRSSRSGRIGVCLLCIELYPRGHSWPSCHSLLSDEALCKPRRVVRSQKTCPSELASSAAQAVR